MVMELPATLLGRYALEEIVGVGGMGTVVRAHDDVLGRTVAVKLLKPEFSTDVAMVERFRREARIAAALSHPGIAQVYDFAEESGRVFIVMEFLEGEDLYSLLSRKGSISPRVASAIGAACAEALEVAHKYGAVHRDVKPGNIFLTTGGVAKLTDFGIARAASQAAVTVTGSVVGTSLYISPEQASGAPATPASDIYSLGCVLFEMVTGRVPFEAESQVAVAMAHLTEPPPRPGEINSRVPKPLDDIIHKSLAKSPADRFASAGEMRTALSQVAKGTPVPVAERRTVFVGDRPTDRTDDRVGQPTAAITPSTPRPRTQMLPASDVAPPQAKHPDGTDEVGRAERIARWGRGGRRRLLALAALAILIGVLPASRLINFQAPSTGAQTVEVPNFVGSSFEEAAASATRLGIELKRIDKPSERAVGQVFEQDLAPGTLIRGNAVVTLGVSIGPREKVPSVVDLELDEAKKLLERQGFKVKVEGSDDGDSKVLSQSPQADAEVPPGSEIELTTEAENGKRGRGRGGSD